MSVKGRLTVSDSIYHQRAGKPPVGFSTPFGRNIDTDVQLFQRELTLTSADTWVSVKEGCWVENVGMLLVECCRKSRDNMTVGIMTDSGGMAEIIVRKGESCRFEPKNIADIFVKGTSKATIIVFPG